MKIDERLSEDTNNPNLHFNRAVLYYNLGLALTENTDLEQKAKLDTLDVVFKASIESYKTTLQLDPNNDRALLYLLDAYKANAKPFYDLERNLDFLALKAESKFGLCLFPLISDQKLLFCNDFTLLLQWTL